MSLSDPMQRRKKALSALQEQFRLGTFRDRQPEKLPLFGVFSPDAFEDLDDESGIRLGQAILIDLHNAGVARHAS